MSYANKTTSCARRGPTCSPNSWPQRTTSAYYRERTRFSKASLRLSNTPKSWKVGLICFLFKYTVTIWILDSMGVWYSNGKVTWLGRPFEYQTFCTINRLFQSGFQNTIWIPDWQPDTNYHLNTRLVWYSGRYCTNFKFSFLIHVREQQCALKRSTNVGQRKPVYNCSLRIVACSVSAKTIVHYLGIARNPACVEWVHWWVVCSAS